MKDREILRELACSVAQIASLPIQDQTKQMWRKHNGLEKVRPLVCIDQLPWHELNQTGELTLLCQDPYLRKIEKSLRQTLYKWNHFPADMVVENRIDIPREIHGLRYGLDVQENTLATDTTNDVVSHQYIDQCETEEALSLLKNDQIWLDTELDQMHLSLCQDIFAGIMPIRFEGVTIHAGVWDRIAQARPISNIMYDMMDRPELILKTAEKFLDLTMSSVDQCEKLGILEYQNPLIHCTGAYVDELPQKNLDPLFPKTKDCWSLGMAQIFSSIGPDDFESFEIDVMRPLYERFGLLYYGCCEPLERKLHLVKKIKNVRKISVSPWAKIEESAEQLGTKYVYSGKAHPVYVAGGTLEAENVKMQVNAIIEACQRHQTPCEIILKDVSTVSSRPQVLEEWEKLVMSIVKST